jgi:hypothetical protein
MPHGDDTTGPGAERDKKSLGASGRPHAAALRATACHLLCFDLLRMLAPQNWCSFVRNNESAGTNKEPLFIRPQDCTRTPCSLDTPSCRIRNDATTNAQTKRHSETTQAILRRLKTSSNSHAPHKPGLDRGTQESVSPPPLNGGR